MKCYENSRCSLKCNYNIYKAIEFVLLAKSTELSIFSDTFPFSFR